MALVPNTVGAKKVPLRAEQTPIGAIYALAASSTGNGTAFDIGLPRRRLTVQAQLTRASTASPATAGLVLQGSLNGTLWHNLGNKVTVSTAGVLADTTADHAVTFVRVQASSKAAGAGAWTLNAWLGVSD